MQKRITLVLLGIFGSTFGFGQFEKGSFVTQYKLDNLPGIKVSTGKNFPHISFSNTAGAGYFIKNNWEIGVSLNYNQYRDRINGVAGVYTQQLHSTGIGVYSNLYFGKGRLKPYLTFQSGWQRTTGFHKIESTGVITNINFSRYYLGGGLGINYSIRKRASIFAEATYLNTSPFYSKTNELNISAGIRLQLNQKKKFR